MGGTGFEPNAVTSLHANSLRLLLSAGAARSDAIAAENGPLDTDLLVVVQAWPDLPEAIRQEVVALARRVRLDR